jgi:peptide methionine sulfoxide reductase msrA/msrB
MRIIKIVPALLILLHMGNDLRGQFDRTYNILTDKEAFVIKERGTERAYTGKYTDHKSEGTYVCRQCGEALYNSTDKFDSHCGWPSFDDEVEGAVTRIPDRDGLRTEIVCTNCNAHLGHVFLGEGFTASNTRHCVNSVSLDFVPAILEKGRYETAILAGGCFWGVEYYLQQLDGVETVTSGYTGGRVKDPTYKEICTGLTGHAEAVKVIYDPDKISYEEVVKNFLEIHDPTQVGRQGPDIGDQYRSEIFYMNLAQKATAEKLLGILEGKGLNIATKVTIASEFYDAEDYHQEYYFNNGKTPYCHAYKKRF